jgi:hypothetical protein
LELYRRGNIILKIKMNKNTATILGTLFGSLLFAGAYITLMPLAVIWSLNELFRFGIPFTFWTWLAAFLLLGVIKIKLNK